MGFISYLVIGYVLKLFFFDKGNYEAGLGQLWKSLVSDGSTISKGFFDKVTKWFPLVAFVVFWPFVMCFGLAFSILKAVK